MAKFQGSGFSFQSLNQNIKVVKHYLKNKVEVVDFANAQGPEGPAGFEILPFAGFCKIYYSHFIFEVITFLSKIQNYSKKLSNYGSFSKI